MKLKILLSLILLSLLSIRALPQGYMSILGEESSEWIQYMEIPDGETFISINTIKDTIINTLEYKQISIDWDDQYFLREDTTTGKVWILDAQNELEYLVMDLSLSIGDTFSTSYNSPATVIDVHYDEGRKVIELNYLLRNWCNEDSLSFIEGIGPDAGFVYQFEQFMNNGGINNFLLCAFQNDVKVYSNEFSTESCSIIRNCVRIDVDVIHPVNIYPNPSLYSVHIVLDKQISGCLELYNSIGQLCKKSSIDSDNIIEIAISDLTEGLYFIEITKDSQILYLGYFLKKK